MLDQRAQAVSSPTVSACLDLLLKEISALTCTQGTILERWSYFCLRGETVIHNTDKQLPANNHG